MANYKSIDVSRAAVIGYRLDIRDQESLVWLAGILAQMRRKDETGFDHCTDCDPSFPCWEFMVAPCRKLAEGVPS